MALFEVTELEKTYYGEGVRTPVLKGLSFTIEEGEFVSIMGPSGSGKSTLLHILGFLAEHTGGTYTFKEKKFDAYSESEVAAIRNQEMGFVFQSFNLLPRESVFENVCLPLLYSSLPESGWEKRVKEVIHKVGLSHRSDYETSRLSGGEKQRVAIARAIVNNPAVIFADEPTGNLDSESGRVVMDILADLHAKRGHTIILITHETQTAEYADRIIHIADGQIERDHTVHKKHHRSLHKLK